MTEEMEHDPLKRRQYFIADCNSLHDLQPRKKILMKNSNQRNEGVFLSRKQIIFASLSLMMFTKCYVR
jgi:hypothetical protein